MIPRLRGLLLAGGVDIVATFGLYYLLRAAGVAEYVALLISSLPPALSAGVVLVRRRRLNRLSIYMATMMMTSAVVSLLIHDARFLLAKDGWFTAVAGLWFLITALGRRPLAFTFSRFLLEGRIGPGRPSWDLLWGRLPRFRRIWRTATVIYGIGLLFDAAVRVITAYTLPVDLVPGLGTAQYVVFVALIQIVINVYLVPTGLYNPYSQLYSEVRT